MIRLLMRWFHKQAFAVHVIGCGRCALIVKLGSPPAWLCEVGRSLGRKAWVP